MSNLAQNAGRPIVFLGLDSAEPELLRRWMDGGELPVLASIMQRSTWGDVSGPPGLGNRTFWNSLVTGVNPARHGQLFSWQLVPGTYDCEFSEPDSALPEQPLWAREDINGKRCAIIDVVRAPLTPNLNGIQVCDWLAHDRYAPARSHPASLIETLHARFGEDPLEDTRSKYVYDEKEFVFFCEALIKRIETKTRYLKELLVDGDWDLVMAAYHDPHDAGHMCWHLHDPQHPLHDPKLRAKLGDPILNVYRAIDRAIGDLMEVNLGDAIIILFAGPGIGPLYSGRAFLEDIVARLTGENRKNAGRLESLKSSYARHVPESVRAVFRKATRRGYRSLRSREWSRSQCFVIPHTSQSGMIRLNVAGREPNGRVQPGQEFDDLCSRLENGLREIVNAETGQPIVQDVIRVKECYSGDALSYFPDLIVEWNSSDPIVTIQSPQIGTITRTQRLSEYTGGHTNRSFFMIHGAHAADGQTRQDISYLDFAVTIQNLLGLDVQALDGTPIDLSVSAGSSGGSALSTLSASRSAKA